MWYNCHPSHEVWILNHVGEKVERALEYEFGDWNSSST